MDSRVQSWLEIMGRDSNEKWTDVSRLYDRHLWKGPAPTARGKSPVDGRPGRKPQRDEKRKQRREAGPRVEKRPNVQAQASKEPEKAKEPARDPSLPKELSFKPFSALVGSNGEGNS
jgi:3'-5' exoribonuclease